VGGRSWSRIAGIFSVASFVGAGAGATRPSAGVAGKIGGCGTSGAVACGSMTSSMITLFARPTGAGVTASTSSWRASVVNRAGASTRYAFA
jgi:hypothetical protein